MKTGRNIYLNLFKIEPSLTIRLVARKDLIRDGGQVKYKKSDAKYILHFDKDEEKLLLDIDNEHKDIVIYDERQVTAWFIQAKEF